MHTHLDPCFILEVVLYQEGDFPINVLCQYDIPCCLHDEHEEYLQPQSNDSFEATSDVKTKHSFLFLQKASKVSLNTSRFND